jgi:hypothetical protein
MNQTENIGSANEKLAELDLRLEEVKKKMERLCLKGNNDEKINDKYRSLIKERFNVVGHW